MLEGNSIDQLMPNIDSVKSVESSLPSCSMLKGDLVDQLMPNVDSVKSVERHLCSLGRSCIGVKKIRVNESIDYEATSNYGFEDESRKRSLKGNNRKVKKHCDDISITNLFGDQRMESEPEETCLDLPNLSMEQNIQNPIAYLQLSVPLFPTRVPFVDIHNPLTKSPVERKKPANQCVYTPEELDQLDLAGLPEPKTKEQLDEINFWKEVGNKITAKAEFTKANLEQLPINDVCPSMFTMTFTDNDEAKTEVDGSSHEVAEEKEYSSGAANVTIGGNTPAESNVHGKVVKALSGNKILSPSDTKLEIYVVRPDNSFVSGSNPNYLEIHFPDLLPFGREVDFVLPMYDMVTRQQVSTNGFVRSKIPSRRRGADGTLSTNAEAFGQISLEDMKKVCEHKMNCAKTGSKGGTLPPLVSLHGVAAEFFNITVATKHNQHSMAAAAENRGGVYAAHNSLGKAYIWFTFSPDDTKSFKILLYARRPEQSAIYKTKFQAE
ncbi:Uncharacterized protein APZ42_025093 [Daphnia magna]|uniref:Uncharacterized protein n=1 Tax=Daphnia magna TaxID=35525 RepID=A0A164TGR6_9CRUS|nr:Uncharacterized protein APZ42_025093 [Daphnia magna]